MKLAISAERNSDEAKVDPRFGRCEYFAIVNDEGDQWEYIPNPGKSSKKDVRTARELVRRKVNCILTYRIDPYAMGLLKAAGIKVYTGVYGTIQEVFEQYKNGILEQPAGSNAEHNQVHVNRRK